MRRFIVVSMIAFPMVALLAACGREAARVSVSGRSQVGGTPQPVPGVKRVEIKLPDRSLILDRAMIGSKLGVDGTVAEEKQTFAPGERVFVTLWLRQSPTGLQTSAWWYDASGKLVHRELRPMNGGKIATFELHEKVKSGKYRVETHWGGDIAAEYDFEVKK